MKFVGTIGRILDRSVNTRFGAKTFYSLKLDEHPEWISLGTKSPERFQEGDEVEVYAEQDDRGYWNARAIEPIEQPGSVSAPVARDDAQGSRAEQADSRASNPVRAAAPAARSSRSSSRSARSSSADQQRSVGDGSQGGTDGAAVRQGAVRGDTITAPSQSSGAEKEAGLGRGGNSRDSGVDRQTSIVLQHSQEMALRAISVLLEHDGLPLTKASNKAGEAKRFDEIVAAIDKLTVKYYRDAETGRLLETVADMGVVDTSADGPIPDAAPSETSNEDDNL